MIELFARTDFVLKKMDGLAPIYIDDEVSSLSAILLNNNYFGQEPFDANLLKDFSLSNEELVGRLRQMYGL